MVISLLRHILPSINCVNDVFVIMNLSFFLFKVEPNKPFAFKKEIMKVKWPLLTTEEPQQRWSSG